MKNLVILCVKADSISTNLVRGLLLKLDGATFLRQYTTNKNESEIYEIISTEHFFDMVEECKFLEFHKENDEYYGTPYISRENTNSQSFMLNNVEVALNIKEYYRKATTIYVISKDDFSQEMLEAKVKLLDFLVIYSSEEEAIAKIKNIFDFLQENSMI